MKLGILVITDRSLEQISGIVRAAERKGHAVTIFVTDEGVKLLAKRKFSALSRLRDVSISYCERSAGHFGGRPARLPAAIRPGGQLDNAVMNAECEKVVVL